jgi:hypothetical protein
MQGQSPSVEFLEALCAALKLSGDWVLTGRGPMHAVDIRGHALKEAGAGALFTAMATNIEQLVGRVERLERYTQSLENMVRVGGGAGSGAGGGAGSQVETGSKGQGKPQGAAEMHDVKPTAVDASRRVSSIADAVAERPREDAR